jgi:hypothetical protein
VCGTVGEILHWGFGEAEEEEEEKKKEDCQGE